MALTDIRPGDGATMVVPGSHKANFPHPQKGGVLAADGTVELEAAIEVPLKKGDALLFVDGLMHGGSERTNSGERRILIYRYGLPWMRRFGYQYEPQLLESLTPERRRILEPTPPIHEGDTRIPSEMSP
jgi:ectoine hydroxylase-related dioxygenase (phytanoyl-CoA dioxygenase family)